MAAAPRWLPLVMLGLLATAIALRGGVRPGAAALLCLLTGAIGLVAAAGRRLPALSPAAWGLALLWSGVALASIFWSRHVDASLDGSAAVICASLVWMLGATLVDGKARRRFVIGLAICGAAVASLALAKATPGQPAAIPLGNPNHLAGWLLLPGSVALVALLFSDPTRRGSRESALLWFGLVGIIGAGIAATASRGAGLSAGLALAALLILYLLGPRRGILAAVSGVVAAALILLFAPALAPDLLPLKVAGGESSVGMRWAVYAASASAALDVVPLGAGLGAFASVFEAYRPPAVPYAVNFAHSEPLQGVVELGIPFLAVFAVTVFVAGRAARRILSRPQSPRFTWGAVTAILGLSAHSLIDFPLHVPAIALAGAALAGLAFAGSEESRGPDRVRSAATTRLIVAGLSIALLALAGSQAVAVLFAERADQRLAVGDFEGSLRAAEYGLRARPGRTALLSRAASAAEHQYRFRGGDPKMLRRALEARSRAVNADRGNAVLRIEQARTRVLAGDMIGAQRDLEIATRRDSMAPVALLARARLDLRRGDPAAAVAALRSALELHPRAAEETATAVLHGTGDPGFLRASMPRDAGGHRTAAGVLARAGFLRHAAEEYEGAFASNPEDMESALSAGANFVRVGDPAAAQAVLERARRHSPEDARIERALALARAAR
jgi:tetratricopeptide (TPR) repeat protein